MPRWVVWLLLAALVAWSFCERWHVLASSPFPLGVDGYFYPIEVRSLLAHGTLAYPASPLALWWMAPFAAATDPITGAKLAAALGGALVALPAYGVGARLGQSRAAGLVAAAVATLSAGSAYLSIEFVKQGIGLTVALAALYAVLRAAETPTRARVATAAGALLAAVLTHKLAAALVVVVAIAIVIQEGRGRGTLRGRRLLYMVGALVALALLGVVSPQRFASFADLSHATAALTSDPRWDGAALARPSFVLAFDHEAFIGVIVALAAGAVLWSTRPQPPSGHRVAAQSMIVLALLIGLPWLAVTDPQGLGFRLRVSAFVPLAACAAIVAGAIPARARMIAAVAVAVAIAALPRDRAEGKVLAHPALVASALALADHIPAGATVIVPERHVEYIVAWYTRAPVSARADDIPAPRRLRVLLPLSSANTAFPLDTALAAARAEPSLDPPIDLHPRARDGFVVVTEATWAFILAQLPERSRQHYAAPPPI